MTTLTEFDEVPAAGQGHQVAHGLHDMSILLSSMQSQPSFGQLSDAQQLSDWQMIHGRPNASNASSSLATFSLGFEKLAPPNQTLACQATPEKPDNIFSSLSMSFQIC